jgi:homogentisate 1,2-dioxygenase
LIGIQGFSGVSALVYHLHPPTIVKHKGKPFSVAPKIAVKKNSRGLKGFGNFKALF